MTTRPAIAVAWPLPDYREALERAGAEVRELTPGGNPLPHGLDGCHGLLLTGGPDVDPAVYGAAERHATVTIDQARDEYELALAREALARDLPVFAVCRGLQVLNVAAGGTLIQDIPSEQPGALAHAVHSPKDAPAHAVTVDRTTCLGALLVDRLGSDDQLLVNSRHHQSVAALAPGFVIAATAPDGVVEAIEHPDRAFCLGVQWHPENFWRTGEFSGLFQGLVDAARQRALRNA